MFSHCFFQCSFSLSLGDAFCAPQSKAVCFPQGQTHCAPWPNQQHLWRNFRKIWELGHIRELCRSKTCYKNAMQPTWRMKIPPWIFEILLICNSFSFQSKKKKLEFLLCVPILHETILNWGVGVCLLCFWRVRAFIYKQIRATALFLVPLPNTYRVL